ncbi:hypothetical protein ACFTAO_38075 [Paenibacillus rhizoplanae]
MRLTFPVLTLSRGGAQRMITELANRLAEIGHEVVVLLPSHGFVEYEMKCPIITAPATVLTEDDFSLWGCHCLQLLYNRSGCRASQPAG